jgi:hypothetical protein
MLGRPLPCCPSCAIRKLALARHQKMASGSQETVYGVMVVNQGDRRRVSLALVRKKPIAILEMTE